MPAAVLQQDLKQALSVLSRVNNSGGRPIYDMVKISPSKSNEGVEIEAYCDVGVFRITIPTQRPISSDDAPLNVSYVSAKRFSRFVASLGRGEEIALYSLDPASGSLVASCPGAKATFRGWVISESESHPLSLNSKENPNTSGDFGGRDFIRAFSCAAFAVSRERVRHGLDGVHFDSLDGAVRFVATDGHRLSMCEAAHNGNLKIVRDHLLPYREIGLFNDYASRAFRKDVEEQVSLSIFNGLLPFVSLKSSFGVNSCISADLYLIPGSFPDYAAVVPVDGSERTTARVRKADLLRAARTAKAAFKHRRNAAVLEIRKTEIKITQSVSVLTAEGYDTVETRLKCDTLGDELKIGFNLEYVIDSLNHAHAEHLEIRFTHALAPALLVGLGHEDWKHVLMPMRID